MCNFPYVRRFKLLIEIKRIVKNDLRNLITLRIDAEKLLEETNRQIEDIIIQLAPSSYNLQDWLEYRKHIETTCNNP